MYFLSVTHADPFSKVHLNNFASFLIFSPVFSFWLLPPFWCCLCPSALFDRHFLLHPHHIFRPSLWSFCCRTDAKPMLHQNQKEKEPLPKYPQTLSRSGLSFTSFAVLLFLYLSLFLSYTNFFALLPPFPFSCASPSFYYLSLSSFSSSSSLSSTRSELTIFPPDGFCL